MATFAFSGGTLEDRGYGQLMKYRFGGTWAVGDTWTAEVTSVLSGDFTLGKGRIAGQDYLSLFKYGKRAILGFDGGFALSAIDNPAGWEEQDVGAAVIPFSTQYGEGDKAYGFSTIGGKLIVFGKKTTHIWSVDADPTKWVLSQVLDNTGTGHTFGVQAIGEVDVLYPDVTGIRSLRAKELSGDAFVADVGTPIDSIVRAKIRLAESNSYPVCAAVDPQTKNYWIFIYDTLYCLSQHPTSKITAWSSFTPDFTDATLSLTGTSTITGLTVGRRYHWNNAGTGATSLTNGTETVLKAGSFVAQGTSVTITGASGSSTLYAQTTIRPVRMWVNGGLVYLLSSDKKLYRYSVNQVDYCYTVAETSWLDFGNPSQVKQFLALDISAIGSWRVSVATNPATNNFVTVAQISRTGSPTVNNSSSYDVGRYPMSGNGTHIKLRFECSDGVFPTTQAKLSSVNIIYQSANEK